MKHDPARNHRMDRPANDRGEERSLRMLRTLPRPVPPEHLGTQLRIFASRQVQRRAARRMPWLDRLRFSADEMMRPLALPFAGGVFAAVILFSMFVVPAYPVRAASGMDVPTILTTEATLKGSADLGMSGEDVVVDVTVDQAGRMADYTIERGPSVLADPALRRRLENMLLFTQFVPATAFGMPAQARIRITIRSSQVDVKG